MRRATTSTAMILAVLLLGIDVGLRVSESQHPRSALAQADSGNVVIAAGNTQNEAFCFLYSPATRQLASYMQQRTAGGLQLKGIRTCEADFDPRILEYPKSDSETAVRNMKKLVDRLSKGKK